ncbi:SsgA family sporulation/cell division regulator [Sphaerisporangium fuscum]|uniref:SsgA family sporulation/cell division regulator n=1 Tax=Sphaerisporangium fuscum TaxID=2835868 RepID=UPI001BDC5360|nr:SsgA family sporulation/cell division regulator [Sphaerisporangium fuscum]
MNDRISHGVFLWSPGSRLPHQATLIYDPADPFAVAINFQSPSGKTSGITWRFARELLVDAVELDQAGGQGDVLVEPSADGSISIVLYPQTNCVPLQMRRESAAFFLALTYAAVRVGEEAERIDWDAELAQVLGGAA